jgi:predicted transcriptional regulator
MFTLQIQIPSETSARIEAIAASQGRDPNQIVMEALSKYLQWQETEIAIEQSDRGEVIDVEEVFSWLDTWGQPSDY